MPRVFFTNLYTAHAPTGAVAMLPFRIGGRRTRRRREAESDFARWRVTHAIAVVVVAIALQSSTAAAQVTAPASDTALHRLSIDGGLMLAAPAAMPTGLSSGVEAGVLRGQRLAWGARLSWSSATEYTMTSTVVQDDFRVRLVGALQHFVGRGTLALRLEPGATMVHEVRTRDQAARAGLTGPEFNTSAWHLAPAIDFEAAVSLRLIRQLGIAMSGGPSLHWLDDGLSTGWVGTLGVTWLH